MMVDGFTFSHSERLKFRKQIETLFQQGEAFSVYPFRVVHCIAQQGTEKDAPVRAGFSVPKKKMRHAHQRNRIKRLLREAWRHRKHEVYPTVPPTLQLHIFFIFTGREIPDWPATQKAMSKIIHNLQLLKYPQDGTAG